MNAILSSFWCKKDNDLRYFLLKKAVDFELLMRSRTYLMFDEQSAREKNELKLIAYFTISLKVLDIPEGIDAEEIIELDGKYSKFHDEPIKSLPCYLIGQLGRNDNTSNAELDGKEILERAIRIIKQSHEAVGGRLILIECKDNEKLIEFYNRNKFAFFRREAFGRHSMIQMIYRMDRYS